MKVRGPLHLENSFPRTYECEQLDELPSGVLRFYFPGARSDGGNDGPIVLVTPSSAERWVGIFAFGHHGPSGTSCIYAFPDPDVICVVSSGDGYLVNVNVPTNWRQIEVYPICEVIPFPGQNIIVFVSHTDMTAFGAHGVVWRTKRLAWSGMKITNVTPASIKGETWDIRSDANIAFSVDVRTGCHHGGIEE